MRLQLSDRNAHLIDDHIDAALRIGALPDSQMAVLRLGQRAAHRLRQRGVLRAPHYARRASRSLGLALYRV